MSGERRIRVDMRIDVPHRWESPAGAVPLARREIAEEVMALLVKAAGDAGLTPWNVDVHVEAVKL